MVCGVKTFKGVCYPFMSHKVREISFVIARAEDARFKKKKNSYYYIMYFMHFLLFFLNNAHKALLSILSV